MVGYAAAGLLIASIGAGGTMLLNAATYVFPILALAAIRMHEVLDGHDHSQLRRNWMARVGEKLVHAETGLLCSSFTYDGTILDGPEGSTIWMASHFLQIVDEDFAAGRLS